MWGDKWGAETVAIYMSLSGGDEHLRDQRFGPVLYNYRLVMRIWGGDIIYLKMTSGWWGISSTLKRLDGD